MNDRRHTIIVLCGIALAGILTLIITTHPFAQPPPGMMGAPDMGGPGMTGARGGVGGAANLRWEEHKMPKEKTMTYPKWLAQEGQGPVPIPRWFLRDEDGKPKEYTDAEWHQLHTLYTGAAIEEREAWGGPGGKLIREVQKQLVVEKKEAKLPQSIYEAGLNHFYFRVTYPTYNIGQVTEDGVNISFDVLMHVKESLQRSYGEFVCKKLGPYSNPGANRSDLYVITYQRGYWRPYHFRLLPETIAELNRLWAGNTVKMELLDLTDAVIASQTQSAGHSADTINEIAYPPEIDLNPGYEYLTEAQRIDFAGNKLQIHNIHGWRYSFSFSLDLPQLGRLHKVRVQLLDTDGKVRSESTIVGTAKAPYSGVWGAGAATAPAAGAGPEAGLGLPGLGGPPAGGPRPGMVSPPRAGAGVGRPAPNPRAGAPAIR